MKTALRAISRVFTHPLNRMHPLRTLTRVGWWLFNRRYIGKSIVVEMMPGAKLICEPSSSYGSLVFYTRLPEYAEQMFMYNYTKASDVVVDIGAHIGSETILLASKISTGKVYSFEPTSNSFLQLKQNIILNGYVDRVVCEQMAISDKEGKIMFYESKESEINSLIKHESYKKINVQTTTLDSYAKKHQLRRINLLKIDVEGAELKVIKGAKKLLHNQLIDVIIFEVNDSSSQTTQDNDKLQLLLKEEGYVLFSLVEEGKMLPYHRQSLVHNCLAILPNIIRTRLKHYYHA